MRSGFGALQEVVKRQIERNLFVQEDLMPAPRYPQLLRQQNVDGLFPNSVIKEDFQSFKFCKFSYFSIDTQHSANNVAFHRDGTIFRVLNFVRKIYTCGEYFIGKRYTSVSSFYNYPISSKHCYIYEVSDLADALEMHEVSSIAYKGFAVPVNSGVSIVVSRILHAE